MANNKKPRDKKRGKSSKARDRRGCRSSNAHVQQFVVDQGLGETEARIARAAMPSPGQYHTSHWLEAGVNRAVKRVGCTTLEAISVVEHLQRWAHRIGRISQEDAALQMAGLELLRRGSGGEPRTIAPPGPQGPMDLPVEDVRTDIACWEAVSYASGTLDIEASELESGLHAGAAMLLMTHLARTDGVPVRLERLDPSDYAVELTDMVEQDEEAPEGFVPQMLARTATLFERLADNPRMDGAMCRGKAAALEALAIGTTGPSYAA